ncbi:MAG: SCO family protein [Solirubrobacterales bacterium]
MSARTRLVLVVVGLLALTGTIVAAIAASSEDDEPAAVVEGPQSPFEGAVRPQALSGDFSLRNQDGDLVRVADLRGKVVVITPTYTTCEESCPVAVQQVRGAIDDLDAGDRDRVRAFALSVDPDNDTPDRAQEFLLSRRVRGYLDYLLGTRRELQPVWRKYGFAPQTETREHNSYVVLLDGSGRQRVGFPVQFLTPEALAHDIELLLRRPA